MCVCVCGDLHFRPIKFASTERAQAFVYNGITQLTAAAADTRLTDWLILHRCQVRYNKESSDWTEQCQPVVSQHTAVFLRTKCCVCTYVHGVCG